MSDNDDEAKTPRATGSRPRWPFHVARCEKAAASLEALAHRKQRVLTEIDIAGAKRCLEIARALRELARGFTVWDNIDPGVDVRIQMIQRMYDLGAMAEAFKIRL